MVAFLPVLRDYNPFAPQSTPYRDPGPAPAPVPVSPASLSSALAQPKAPIVIGPESDALAKALLASAGQGAPQTPFEAVGKLAQLWAGTTAEDKYQKAQLEREQAPARSLSEALAGITPGASQDDYKRQLGQTLMRIGGQYGNSEWVTKGAELLAPPQPGDIKIQDFFTKDGRKTKGIYDPSAPDGFRPIGGAEASDADKPVVVDGHLVTRQGKELYAAPPKPGFHAMSPGQLGFDDEGNAIAGVPAAKPEPPTDVQNYEYYAAQEKAAGRQPLSVFDWKRELNKSSASVTNLGPTGVDYGEPEKGLAWARNPDGTVKLDDRGVPIAVPYAGGSVATAQAEAADKADKAKAQQSVGANVVTSDVDRTISLINRSPLTTTGFLADFANKIGGSASRDVAGLIDTLKANAAFDRLQAMRNASPTGGALGNVSDTEGKLLSAAIGNLEQSQSKDQLIYNLKRVKNIYLDIIDGPGNGPREPLTPASQAGGPPQPAIDALKQKPALKDEFDRKYGTPDNPHPSSQFLAK